MKVGIIGCGSIAQVHGWVLSQMEDIRIEAVCDIERNRAGKFIEKFCRSNACHKEVNGHIGNDRRAENACHIETDWRQLCDMELDAVHICTPHYLHAPMATELLKNGKAVFMEKPCAVSREQYAQLEEADRMHPGKLGICFQNRFNMTTETADRLVAEGMIGKVTGARAFVTWRRDESYYTGSPWKGKKETEGGGALINQAIHTLDLLLRYLGKPERVEATASNHHLKGMIEVEDTVEALMEFPGGERACFYASNGYAADAPVILEIQGDKGRITVCDNEVTVWSREKGPEHIICEETKGIGKGYWGAGHLACIRDFYEAIRDGRAPATGLKSAEVTFDTMMRIYEVAGMK